MSVKDAPERVDHRCRHRWCEHKPVYVMEASCGNCAWTGEIAVTVGHDVTGSRTTAPCPRCECKRLRTGNFVSREEATPLSQSERRDA